MKYIIYMHKLKKDNRVYIGLTQQKPEKRWQKGLGYKNSTYIKKAIDKYGWDGFEHIILYDNLTREEAQLKEIELIKKYKSNIKGYGFNMNEGGFAPIITEEQKRKISNTEKGKIVSKETIEKIKKSKIERMNTIGLTEKQKEWYKRKIKPIICIETNIIYQGQKDLKENGFNAGNIQLVCNNKRKIADGYHWKYYKEMIISNT